jgi:beta-glucosidase
MLLGVTAHVARQDFAVPDSNWGEWSRLGKIREGGSRAKAGEHWREDALLMRGMGIQSCRVSAPWALLEPGEGCYDGEAFARLREEILLLRGLGIVPLLTLHHFSEPMWFIRKGGWEKEENAGCFLLFVEKLVRTLGQLLSEYITIQEPNVYAFRGYRTGDWPPGSKSSGGAAALRVLSVMAGTHIRCYRLIHDLRRQLGFSDTKVGFCLRLSASPRRLSPPRTSASLLAEGLIQRRLLEAMTTGRFRAPLRNRLRARPGLYCDFFGLSYVGRHAGSDQGAHRDDLGREIYPGGIVSCCAELLKQANLPIYITENGVCDNSDSFRARYICEHLEALCATELPVLRYYYHGLCDGFEWLDGDSAPFGLARIDSETGQSALKPSGEFYAELIRSKGVTPQIYGRYVAGQEYHR